MPVGTACLLGAAGFFNMEQFRSWQQEFEAVFFLNITALFHRFC